MTGFKVGDKVWFDMWQDDFWWQPNIASGKVTQICEINRNQLLIETTKSGHERYHIRRAKDVYSSLSEMRKYVKSLAPVQVGDLVTFIKESWQSPGLKQEIWVGTCIKITEKYAHIQTESGMKKVRKYHCFVTSRPSKESDGKVSG